ETDLDALTEQAKLKLFGGQDEEDEDDYCEVFLNLDLLGGFIYLSEKDPEYRTALLRWLSVK
ncbi:MAG TPA: hypothetical protein VFK82_06280, partial [Burkholderiaceae bacterium]|nr:hypothetical protein [Burkholderiaceae bacterium]